MKTTYNSEYYDYCEKNRLMPTDEGYKIWLKSRIIITK
jgi:hypothetical protein